MNSAKLHHVQRNAIGSALMALAVTASASLPAAAATAAASQPAGQAQAASKKAPAAPVDRIDINSASRALLKTLPGIGDAEADRIVAGRPYLSKAELVTRNVIATGPYLSIKGLIIAVQKGSPKSKP